MFGCSFLLSSLCEIWLQQQQQQQRRCYAVLSDNTLNLI
jgi:hypothetical protein